MTATSYLIYMSNLVYLMSHWGWVADDLPHRLLGQLGDDVVGRALAQVDREPHGHLHRQLVELNPGGEQKKNLPSSVTHVPSGLIGYASAALG